MEAAKCRESCAHQEQLRAGASPGCQCLGADPFPSSCCCFGLFWDCFQDNGVCVLLQHREEIAPISTPPSFSISQPLSRLLFFHSPVKRNALCEGNLCHGAFPAVPAVPAPCTKHTKLLQGPRWHPIADICYLNSCFLGLGGAFPAHSAVPALGYKSLLAVPWLFAGRVEMHLPGTQTPKPVPWNTRLNYFVLKVGIT